MKIIKENNIAKVIIVSITIILSALMIFTIYFSIDRQYMEFEQELNNLKQERINNQKIFLKREVDSIVHFINFIDKNREIDHKTAIKIIKNYINSVRFGEHKLNYVFVYKIINFNGGEKFAKMFINPNRPDLVGKYISSKYKDADGKMFREQFLKDIKKYGESFVIYRYKKPLTNKKILKLSYFKLYKKYNWVIAAGVYLDDIERSINKKREILLKNLKKEIITTVIVYLLFYIIAFLFAMFLGNRIDRFFQSYRDEVSQKTLELENLNKNLEKRVKEEIEKNREQEQFLIQKSKFIALGEMISNIAHQWRQPLNELSSIMMNIKIRYRKGLMSSEYMQKKGEDIDRLLEFMSQTIDDFRNFFILDKKKKLFSVKQACENVLFIMESSLRDKNIKVVMNIDNDVKIYGYESEFEQVILNIISNAKYALVKNKIKDPYIEISLEIDKNNFIKLYIKDNAGGIKIKPIEKIFEPYFTTKDTSSGTGIGLYMSKLIIEKNMGGVLKAYNEKNGAEFCIKIKKGGK